MNNYVRQTDKHNLTINLNQYPLKKLPIWGKENPGMKSSPTPQNVKALARHKHCIQGQESLKLINHYTNVCVWWFSTCCNSTCQHHQAGSSPHHSTSAAPTARQLLEPEYNACFRTAAQLRRIICDVPSYWPGCCPWGPPQLPLHICPAWGGWPEIWVRRKHPLPTRGRLLCPSPKRPLAGIGHSWSTGSIIYMYVYTHQFG